MPVDQTQVRPLYRFAYLPGIHERTGELELLAEPEEWSYRNTPHVRQRVSLWTWPTTTPAYWPDQTATGFNHEMALRWTATLPVFFPVSDSSGWFSMTYRSPVFPS